MSRATELVDFGTWFVGSHGVLCPHQPELWSSGGLEQLLQEGRQNVSLKAFVWKEANSECAIGFALGQTGGITWHWSREDLQTDRTPAEVRICCSSEASLGPHKLNNAVSNGNRWHTSPSFNFV